MSIIVRPFPYEIETERVFARLYGRCTYAFWLDGQGSDRSGRFSWMGGDPFLLMSTRDGRTAITRNGQIRRYGDHPFSLLKSLAQSWSVTDVPLPDIPFLAGGVGYVGYEMKRYMEQLPQTGADPFGLPEMCWMWFDKVMVFDHAERRVWLCKWRLDGETASDVERMLNEWETAVLRAAQFPLPTCIWPDCTVGEMDESAFRYTVSRDQYLRKIEIIQRHIADGDIYQACLTHLVTADLSTDGWELYRVLRRINPTPYSCYLKLGDTQVVSSSPERFLRVRADRMVESSPIKGTRPRGRTPEEDARLANELATHEKDRAENVMIVDLVRNDLGKVAEPGSVRVPELLAVKSYATVHQLVSTVEGRLREDLHAVDALQVAFPGGSMTGAPKIRAMEILDRLEPTVRGIYSGGIGYLDVRGTMDLSMVIRTVICRMGQAFFHVGGGIVADSDPEAEYQETMDKARALKIAINWVNSEKIG
jgi:aminodeoxychorismate synthase component I